MADLLVYNKLHWYDTTTPERRAELDKEFPGKFDTRYRKGDIVEVVADGRYAKQSSKAFAVIHMPGVKVEDAAYLMDPQERVLFPDTPNEQRTVVARRRYNVALAELSLDVNDQVAVSVLADAKVTDKKHPTVAVRG
jgi:hypothetical protein